MQFTSLMLLRSHVTDDRILLSAWFYSERFRLTMIDRKATYALNYHLAHIFDEVFEMAQKPQKKLSGNYSNPLGAVEWHNVNLTVEDGAAIDEWLSTEPDVLGELCRLVTEGYGIAVKPATRGDGFMATITLAAQGSKEAGFGLSAFADTPYEASAALIYKFVFKLEGDISHATASTKARFR